MGHIGLILFVVMLEAVAVYLLLRKTPELHDLPNASARKLLGRMPDTMGLLWLVSKGQGDAPLLLKRMNTLVDRCCDDKLSGWWNAMKGKRELSNSQEFQPVAKFLLEKFMGEGLEKGNETLLVADEYTAVVFKSWSEIEIGKKYMVMRPYWTLDGVIFERGLIYEYK